MLSQPSQSQFASGSFLYLSPTRLDTSRIVAVKVDNGPPPRFDQVDIAPFPTLAGVTAAAGQLDHVFRLKDLHRRRYTLGPENVDCGHTGMNPSIRMIVRT